MLLVFKPFPSEGEKRLSLQMEMVVKVKSAGEGLARSRLEVWLAVSCDHRRGA